MLKLEALPEDIEKKRKARLRNISILVLVLLLILGGGAYFGIGYYQKKVDSELANIQNEVAKVQEEIKKSETDLEGAVLAQKQLENLERLLNQHLYWTKLFATLGEITIPDVFYTSFQGDIDSREVSLPARTRNYQSLARQLKAWEQEGILEKVEVQSATLETSGDNAYVSFDVNLIFKEEAWQEK